MGMGDGEILVLFHGGHFGSPDSAEGWDLSHNHRPPRSHPKGKRA